MLQQPVQDILIRQQAYSRLQLPPWHQRQPLLLLQLQALEQMQQCTLPLHPSGQNPQLPFRRLAPSGTSSLWVCHTLQGLQSPHSPQHPQLCYNLQQLQQLHHN